MYYEKGAGAICAINHSCISDDDPVSIPGYFIPLTTFV
jgi:hypothetical protein